MLKTRKEEKHLKKDTASAHAVKQKRGTPRLEGDMWTLLSIKHPAKRRHPSSSNIAHEESGTPPFHHSSRTM